MIVLFTGEDLESFGAYIVSETRKVLYSNLYSNAIELDNALNKVNERDVNDWLNILNSQNGTSSNS